MTTVDIILFCYKQEQYIEQALRSIYAQELPKDVTARIIVADDCSPDDTLNIIKRLAAESPFPMEFFPEEPNMGISKNYKRSFAATNAEYVAILEGDDYWSPKHIKQHLEFLQAHPECSMSMNEMTFYIENLTGYRLSRVVREKDKNYKLIDTYQQIVYGNQLGNLSACVCRGEYIRELPFSLYDIPVADWMLGIMLSQKGYLGIIQGSTSVYRVKNDGIWAGRTPWQQHIAMLKSANMYDKYQYGKYHKEWRKFKVRCWLNLRHNWMHYMPEFVQKIWHNIKNK